MRTWNIGDEEPIEPDLLVRDSLNVVLSRSGKGNWVALNTIRCPMAWDELVDRFGPVVEQVAKNFSGGSGER